MVKTIVNLSEKANKKVRLYMAQNNESDKRIAINDMIEDM